LPLCSSPPTIGSVTKQFSLRTRLVFSTGSNFNFKMSSKTNACISATLACQGILSRVPKIDQRNITHANRHPRQERCPAPKAILKQNQVLSQAYSRILAYKLVQIPTLAPESLTEPSNHLLGLQTSASSPQISLFLKEVKSPNMVFMQYSHL